jgi:hypothetical protein
MKAPSLRESRFGVGIKKLWSPDVLCYALLLALILLGFHLGGPTSHGDSTATPRIGPNSAHEPLAQFVAPAGTEQSARVAENDSLRSAK